MKINKITHVYIVLNIIILLVNRILFATMTFPNYHPFSNFLKSVNLWYFELGAIASLIVIVVSLLYKNYIKTKKTNENKRID